MTIPDDAQRKIDGYLNRLRRCLRSLRDEDAREIVTELRSHILDKATVEGAVSPAAVESALAGLGPPETLAREYLTNDLLARAQATRSPWLVLRSLFRWASLSAAGFLLLVPSLAGYFVSIVFAWAAFFKPIHPQSTGLWVIPNAGDYEFSLHMGFGSTPSAGHEVLGWWIIPIGLGLGVGLFLLTLQIDLWFLGRFRRNLPMPF
jgi:HAAS domain-containing protein